MIKNIGHHYCSKFETNLTAFGGVLALKNLKMIEFMDALLPRKHLKIYNLRTTNATKMKLDTIVHVHNTFHLTKDLSVSYRKWQGVVGKTLKKAQKIGFLGPFLAIFSNITRPLTYAILCLALHYW